MFRFFKNLSQERWAIIILFISGLYLANISYLSSGLYGDTDSVGHYLIARYAFQHPNLFFHHWGKPIFTILSAPFAQFGMQGAIFFNILCSLVTAWLIFRMAQVLKYRYALAAIPFAIFAPAYMVNILTSLTEILFALVLVAGIYFFLKEKLILSSIIISFLPFDRMEGIMFLVIFLVAFILVKKYQAIPFLLTGFVVISLAGAPFYHDLLWFFNAVPYGEKGSALYGSGSFWYYFERFHQLLGFPLTILAVIGIIYLAISMFREKKPSLSTNWLTEYYLIPVSLFGFILAHSFLWWQGMMGVLASKRFMACIMPLCGFLAVAGFNFLDHYLGEKKLLKKLLLTVIIGVTLYVPYTLYEIPAGLSGNSEVMKASANALTKIGYVNKQVVFFDPKLAFYLHEDPFNRDKISGRLPDGQKKDFGMADSSFLIWDTHFGESENKIYLDDMLDNPNFSLINGFVPTEEFKFHGQNFMALIFQKVPARIPRDEWIRIDSMDFETAETKERMDRLTDSVVFSGHKSNQIGTGWEFSFSMNRKLDEIRALRKVVLRARMMTFLSEGAEPDKLNLVLEVHQASGELYRYVSIAGSYFKAEPGKWFEMSLVTPLQTDFPENGTLRLYAWYTGKNKIFVDDLILEYTPVID